MVPDCVARRTAELKKVCNLEQVKATDVAEVYGLHWELMMLGKLWCFLHVAPHELRSHLLECQSIGKRKRQPIFILPRIAGKFGGVSYPATPSAGCHLRSLDSIRRAGRETWQ